MLNKRMSWVHRIFASLCFLSLASAAWGQFDNGSLVGAVHDNTGAVVSGATVTVTNASTGIATTQTTGDSGQWELPSLRAGTYKVAITKAGFAEAVGENIGLQVGGRQRVDLTLSVGSASETIQVSGVELQLETDSSERGQIITRQEAVQLPLVNRNYSSLVLLTSGTRQSSIGTGSASLTREGSFNVEGLRSTFNNYLLDGLDNNQYGTSNQGFSNQIIQPSPDSITQFQVVTNNEGAEYGRSSGATVNVAFASGTNRFHFDAFEFLRNTSLNATGYFPPNGGVKPPLHRNQFGGNVGGPLMRDKAFFFVDYEGLRQNRSQLAFSSVPTADEAQRYTFPTTITNPFTGQKYAAGTAIPASALSPVARNIAALFPAPNVPGVTSTSNNYELLQELTDKYDKYDARFDIQWNEKSSSFVRVSQFKESAIDFNTLPEPLDGNTNGLQRILDQQIVLGYTRQITASQLLDLRLGGSYTKGAKSPLSLGFSPNGTAFGIPGLPDNNPRVAGGLPTFVATGFTSFGRQATNPQFQYPFLFNPKINYTWVKGQHSLKMGYEYQRIHTIDQDVNPIYGRYTFQGGAGFSGNTFADFLFGAPSRYELTNFFIAHLRQVMHFGYVQDDWKVSDKLTLNLGLRYEYGSPYWDKDGQLSNFDPNTSTLLTAKKDGDTYQRSLVKPDKNDFAPRFGFAFSPDAKTVLRGGFGISYVHFNRAGSGNELAINAPQVSFVVVGQTAPQATTFRRLDQGFAPGLTDPANFNPLTDNITYIPKNYSDSYVENYFLSVQRQITKNALLDVAYVGNHGVKLLEFANLNQGNPNIINPATKQYARPYPTFGDITAALNSAYSNYNSLQVRYEQRGLAGLTLLNSFTYGRTFDTAAGSLEDVNGHFPGPQNIYNLAADYGPSNYDQPLTNVTSFVYELPFGHGHTFGSGVNGLTNEVIGGWQVTGINTMTSGQSLTVQYTPTAAIGNQVSGISADFRGANNYRANRLPGVSVLAHKAQTSRSFVQYLNNIAGPANSGIVGAFQNPITATGQPFGNSRNGLAYSDPFFNLDFSAQKSFALPTEGMNLQFRSEFYNLLNKTNFAAPAISISSGNFGQISSTFPARVIQFGLKLTY